MKEIESPCIKKCALNEENICTGCFRTIQEIITWPSTDDETKRRIAVLSGKRKKGQKEKG
jgi:predicted Fe-S protein YdhL (DUF1289 family)